MSKKRVRFVKSTFKKSIKQAFYWSVALALLPTVWVSFVLMAKMIPALGYEGIAAWWIYVLGGSIYLLLEKTISKPMFIYVFGHELTHALAGLLTGAKIHSFKVGSHGGEVRLSKSNLFVALAPYVFPIYTILTMAVYALVRIWWDHPMLYVAFQFLVGVTLMFHLSMTFAAVHGRQPDLKILGLFLSGVLILLANSLILGVFGVSLFSRTPTLKQYSTRLINDTGKIWATGLTWVNRTIEREFEMTLTPKGIVQKLKS